MLIVVAEDLTTQWFETRYTNMNNSWENKTERNVPHNDLFCFPLLPLPEGSIPLVPPSPPLTHAAFL